MRERQKGKGVQPMAMMDYGMKRTELSEWTEREREKEQRGFCVIGKRFPST